MRIECEVCNATYTIDDAQLSDQPIGAQCPYCGHVRLVRKGDAGAAAAPPPSPFGGAGTSGDLSGDLNLSDPQPPRPGFGGGAPSGSPFGGSVDLSGDLGSSGPPSAGPSGPGGLGFGGPPPASATGASPFGGSPFSGNPFEQGSSGGFPPNPPGPSEPPLGGPPGPPGPPAGANPFGAGGAGGASEPASPFGGAEGTQTTVDEGQAGCQVCGTPLTDEFDKVIGLCDVHQRDRRSEGAQAAESVGQATWHARSAAGHSEGPMSLEDLRGAIREGRFSPDDEFSQDGMNYGPISQFKDIAYLASLKVGGQAGVAAPRSSYARPKQSVEVGRLITPILVIALIGGLGFVGYTQRETLMKLYSGFMSEAPKAKPTTTNPLKRYIATWTAAHPDVSGTVQEHLVSARLRHLEDTWKAYQTAEQAYQRALILDVDDATAIGGYVENLALWRYDLATVKEVQVARAAVKYAMELAPNNPAVFRAQAALALAAGDLNGCREGADAALKKDATDGRAKLLLSGCYMEGNVQLAIQEAERARQLQPELRRVDRVLGEAYAKTGRFASALKTLDERLKVDPDNGSVHKLYGDIARGVAMFDRAESHYRKAIAAKNDVQDAHLALADLKLELSQTSEAIREYKKAAELFPEQLGVRAVRAYAGWAQSELLRRRSERAKTLSERAMKVAGDEPRALIYIGQAAIVRGQAAVALGEPQVAITYANRAKEAVSEPSGLVLLGRAKVAMRQMDAGIKTLEEAVSADSKDPRLKGILAATYLARGGQPQAYALMRRAADVDPQQAWSRRRRGPMSLSEIPVREAIQRFRSSAGEERNASVASSAMGMLYYFLGDAGRAKAAIERALRIDNSNVTALIYDAQLALDRKDPKRAQRSALRLLAVERGSALGHLLHARALKMLQKEEEAREAFRAALRSNPGLLSAKVELSELALATSERDQAIEDLKRAFRVDPHGLRTRQILLKAGL